MKFVKKHILMFSFIVLFLMIWSVFFSIDYIRTQQREDPIFIFYVSETENEVTYIGLFYMVSHETQPPVYTTYWNEDEPYVRDVPYVHYSIYPWFMKSFV